VWGEGNYPPCLISTHTQNFNYFFSYRNDALIYIHLFFFRDFHMVMLAGVRALVEQQPPSDDYSKFK
jgi:hypothetical protein